MIRRFVADLHVHTVLSPCAAVEMTPRNIILHAVECGVDIVAITDHNAGDNLPAAIAAAQGLPVTVIPGMEVETREEAHLVVRFEGMRELAAWDKFVRSRLQGRLNDEAKYGPQFVVDAEDELIKVRPDLLLTSLDAGLSEITAKVAALGGIVIASHVDRPAFSLVSQLGFIPPDAGIDAVEVSRHMDPETARRKIPGLGSLEVITSSDAHAIDDFMAGPKTIFYLKAPTLAEIRLALRGMDGRSIAVRAAGDFTR